MEGVTRLGRGGTNVGAGVVSVTISGASVDSVAPVDLMAFVLVDAAWPVLVAVALVVLVTVVLAFVAVDLVAVALVAVAFVTVAFGVLVAVARVPAVAFVALVARAFVVVVALVAVLVDARLGLSDGVVAGGRRRAGAFFATAAVVRLAGARLVRLAGCFCHGSSMDIPVDLPMDAGFGETETVVSCWVSFLAQ